MKTAEAAEIELHFYLYLNIYEWNSMWNDYEWNILLDHYHFNQGFWTSFVVFYVMYLMVQNNHHPECGTLQVFSLRWLNCHCWYILLKKTVLNSFCRNKCINFYRNMVKNDWVQWLLFESIWLGQLNRILVVPGTIVYLWLPEGLKSLSQGLGRVNFYHITNYVSHHKTVVDIINLYSHGNGFGTKIVGVSFLISIGVFC